MEKMHCCESVYMQAYQQRKILIEIQQVNDINRLFVLDLTSRGQLHIM